MDLPLRPTLELLPQSLVERVVAEALEVLAKVGVFVEHPEALALLGGAGARVEASQRRAFLPEELVWDCVRSAPSAITLFDRHGTPALQLEGWNVYFNPGSAALWILDSETGTIRPPATADLVQFARLTDALEHLEAQSTALIPADVPRAIADRYRLYLALLHSRKPIVTGTFTVEGFAVMRDLLSAVAGGEEALRERPTAIFDACPSPPLKWSSLTAQSLLDCARSGLPAELVSMPLLGATAPLTLLGGLVQHTAENLSGVVIHQLAGPGAPIIYGGSPAAFDLRYGTPPMGAIETMMLDCAYVQVGRYLGLPTHAYLGLSDAKVVDAQAGLEAGLGTLLAALAGVNVVSGAGMLDFESCQSLEKLVLDHEICGLVKRLLRGVEPRSARLAEDLFGDLSAGDCFLASPTTLRWLREEIHWPSEVLDRATRESGPSGNLLQRARAQAQARLAAHRPTPLPEEVQKALTEILAADARRHGIERLPEGREAMRE
jgi:trimethylamine--corrinoid protein Co-methyltransferase